jgi:hypothetical protein
MIIKVEKIYFRIHKNKNKNELVNFVLVPFIPSQPIEILKSGNMYLKSIDKNHRRYYEKYLVKDNSIDDKKYIQQLYVSDNYQSFFILFLLIYRMNIFKLIKLMVTYIN